MGALLGALEALLLKDKAWVAAALNHLPGISPGDSAGGRLTNTAAKMPPEQRRRLYSFDLGRSVGLELTPSIQQLAELFLCSEGEEVRERLLRLSQITICCRPSRSKPALTVCIHM